MKKLLFACFVSLGALSVHAGSCANFIKITQIGNVEVEVDGNILIHPKVMAYGNIWNAATLSGAGHLIVRTSSSQAFRNQVLATTYTAQASGEPVYVQVAVETPDWFRIEKISSGPNPLGLDCQYFQGEVTR